MKSCGVLVRHLSAPNFPLGRRYGQKPRFSLPDLSRARCAKGRQTAITAERNDVQMAKPVDALEAIGHHPDQKPHPHTPRVGHPQNMLCSEVSRWCHAPTWAAKTLLRAKGRATRHPPFFSLRRCRAKVHGVTSKPKFRRSWARLPDTNHRDANGAEGRPPRVQHIREILRREDRGLRMTT
jgi:hypothetical protein